MNLVEDTAIDGIERQFGVKVDRKNLKRQKLEYKGTPTATVIRTKSDGSAKKMDDNDDPIKNMPYPFDGKTSE
jgi:dynein assembly factor 2